MPYDLVTKPGERVHDCVGMLYVAVRACNRHVSMQTVRQWHQRLEKHRWTDDDKGDEQHPAFLKPFLIQEGSREERSFHSGHLPFVALLETTARGMPDEYQWA